MTDPLLDSYEALAYESKPIVLADADSIAANAMLHGLTPPPPDSARILELGCASGGNIVSMAYAFPKARFVGVDLSPGQVEAGRMLISEMGLQNITLHARSIDTIDESFGLFDYVICHGVYSWVPPHIQDAILRVCARHLNPNGIAYVSYNTYPGWHQRRMLRDMLMFHDEPSLLPDERIARAREFSKFLGTFDPDNSTIHVSSLRAEHTQLATETDQHLFHEQLEPYNEPIYFAEFAKRAAAHGLQYVAEAKPTPQNAATAAVRRAMGSVNDVIRSEQYVDFVIGRTFRRTLLCHKGIEIARQPSPEAAQRLHVRSRVVPVEPAKTDASRGGDVQSFRSPAESVMTTNNPLVLAILHVLAEVTPAVLSFAELHRRVAERLATAEDESVRGLADDPNHVALAALQCAPSGHVEFRTLPSRFVVQSGKRPKASALARFQANYNDAVSTLGHWTASLSGMERFVLLHLDGASDRDQLVRTIEQALASGDLKIEGRTVTRDNVVDVMTDVLGRLGRAALLLS